MAGAREAGHGSTPCLGVKILSLATAWLLTTYRSSIQPSPARTRVGGPHFPLANIIQGSSPASKEHSRTRRISKGPYLFTSQPVPIPPQAQCTPIPVPSAATSLVEACGGKPWPSYEDSLSTGLPSPVSAGNRQEKPFPSNGMHGHQIETSPVSCSCTTPEESAFSKMLRGSSRSDAPQRPMLRA